MPVLLSGQEYNFKKLTVNDGLSQNDVNSIIQDSYGFIWIGTFDGLNRFDGITVQTFHRISANPESLPDNRISALAEDKQKRIWIGTQSGLFVYYSLLDEKFIRVKSPENIGPIWSFLITADNQLYATSGTGILRLTQDPEPAFELIPGTRKLIIRDGIQDKDGKLYFVGPSGAFTLENGLLKEIPNPEGIQFTRVISTNGIGLLAGTYSGLYKIDNNQIQKLALPEFSETDIVLSLAKDIDGRYWIGTETNGLFIMDSSFRITQHIKSESNEHRGLFSNTVLELYFDKSNNVWVGNRHGLCYTNLNLIGFESLNLTGIIRPNVRSFYVEGNKMLLGISNEGLFKVNTQHGGQYELIDDSPNYINEIKKIRDTIFVCSSNGLSFFTEKNSIVGIDIINSKLSGELAGIRCIASDDFSRKFLGANSGIIVLEGDHSRWIWQDTPSLEPLSDLFVFRMHYDSKTRQLLMGTRSKGLYILEIASNGEFSNLSTGQLMGINGERIENTSVWCFYEDNNKNLWIGTDLGLFKKESGKETFEQISTPDVLDKKIMSITESEDGILWLSNTHGLISFNPESAKVKRYTYEDGLLSSSLTEGAQLQGDTLFIGTTNGVNFIRLSNLSEDPTPPKILISNFRIHNEQVKPGIELFGSVVLTKNINSTGNLELNHRQNNFSLEFSATNYSGSTKNKFRYRLEGFDEKWIQANTDNRIISYSNLDPGKYTLTLQVTNGEGEWSESKLTMPIYITPSPWLTPLAYSAYGLFTILILAGFIYFWFNKQRLNHQIQLDQIKINQDKELRERQLRFFADVAHEFKTPLSLILAPFGDLMNRTMSEERREMCLQIISRNIQRMSFLVSQLLDFDKISEGQKLPRVTKQDLTGSIRNYIKAFNWQVLNEKIDLRLNLDPCTGYFDPDVMEKALYNVMSNALKHTPSEGIVEVSLKNEFSGSNEFATITISDSGSGIPDDQKEHVFERFYHGKDRASSGIGLHLTHRLVLAHGGNISVEDSLHGGAQFKIVIPISKNAYAPEQVDEEEYLNPVEYPTEEEWTEMETPEKEETILIVEDDHDLRNYLKFSLQSDYSVIESNNGEQGLIAAQQNLPDIIISDVMMPIKSGIEMCRELKANKDTSHIPIIFLTAKTDVEYQKKGLEAGAWDYITKPFDSTVLLKKVGNILETRNKFKTYLLDQNINFEVQTHYTSYDQKLLKNINQVIEDNLENPNFTVNELALEVGLSRMHLHRKLKTLTGETAKSIITRVKIKYAVSMFDQGCDRIQEAMNAVGMTNYGNFNSNFKKVMGMTATEYLTNAKND